MVLSKMIKNEVNEVSEYINTNIKVTQGEKKQNSHSFKEAPISAMLICVTDWLFIHDICDGGESKGRRVSNQCLIINGRLGSAL